jgi:hypothetical protein
MSSRMIQPIEMRAALPIRLQASYRSVTVDGTARPD